ncbi:hypothetical protein E8E12_002880 [Didymella heteroderae]|uniref:Xylanolytic transcriptional activator regulatory domain-containing protein n=1 Tax=Didymella heteroderae TaxID=1769908 RepID=A0A9P4WR97_9PLEO|nr:hypothetical protein E8E12_002880 [Didymella heteroderae]
MPKTAHGRRRLSISQASSQNSSSKKPFKSIAYVEELMRENERLRNESSAALSNPGVTRQALIAEDQETVQNPLVEDRAQGWFFPMSSLDMPIHISEAADAAFATRFREALTPHSVHIPRTSYARDDALIMLSESEFNWPSPARARFLVKVALSTVCQYYHIVLRSSVMDALEKAIKNVNDVDRMMRCKLLTLFALGEVYSSRVPAQETTFPGLSYFAQARRMVSIPAERPTLQAVEIALLLVLYSYNLNRRHMAYLLASSAVRLGIVMGLNLNVPDGMYSNPLAREHRTRLWWTAYTLDRTCCSKLGHPASIADEDIIVDYPRGDRLNASTDFEDADYARKSLELAGLDNFNTAAEIIRQLSHMGNFAAKEFLEHLDAMEDSIQKARQSVSNPSVAQQLVISDAASLPSSAPMMTAGMALAEPSLQEFLADTDLTFSGIDNPTFDPLQTPYWPGIWGGDEWADG